jgi:phage-related protein
MPLVRSLGNRLWEVRSAITHGCVARIVFCVVDEQRVLLHGFVKKTQKTPTPDINLALKQMKGAKQ